MWRQDTTRAAEPRAKLSRRGLRWALEGIVSQHLTVARVAEGLGVAWNTANDAVLAEGRRVLIEDPHRFDGVTAIGVDEHVWRHTRRGDKYVTVIIDLTRRPCWHRPGTVAGHGRGPLEAGLQDLARRATEGVARRGGGGRDGRVHRLQDRHHRGAPRRGRGDGSLPRRPPGRRRDGPVPAPDPADHPRPPRPRRRPALPGPPDPAHRRRPPHRQAEGPHRRAVRQRSARPARSDLGDLPADDHRLPRARPRQGPPGDGQAHRRPSAAASRSCSAR